MSQGFVAAAVPRVRVSIASPPVPVLVAGAAVVLAGSAAWLVMTGSQVEYQAFTALFRAYNVAAPMLIGLLWWSRRPGSQLGPLLVLFGVSAWPLALQASDVPTLYTLGNLGEAPFFLLTVYVVLSFCRGRVREPVDYWILLLATTAVTAMLFPHVLPRTSPLIDPAAATRVAFSLTAAVVLLVLFLRRLAGATRPRRRAMMAVALTSLLYVPAFIAYQFVHGVLDNEAQALGWVLVAARVVFPLGFLVALLQADLFAGGAQRRLLAELVTRPSPARWRDAIAEALDDRSLQLGYHDPATGTVREAGGAELIPPPPRTGRRWVPVEREGRLVGAMVTDEVLVEDPELVRAATTATLLAVEHGHLEGELLASRARVVEAGDEARRRLERDLHDSAQQRLVALRVHLELAGERRDVAGEVVAELGQEIDLALEELRSVARGLAPPALAREGVAPALRLVGAAIPVTIADRGLGRHPTAVERAVYFCCLEALQNAAAHAGPGAAATVTLARDGRELCFTVADDGAGFDLARVEPGAGLANMRERVEVLGGALVIDTAPGRGTRVCGRVPPMGPQPSRVITPEG